MCKKVKDEALDVSKDLEKLNSEDFKKTPDIKEIYKVTYQELTSQQTKRDTVFGVFITLFTFAVPLSFTNDLSAFERSWLLAALGLIGIFFSFIIVRYREYKESYWLACRTLSIIDSSKKEYSKKLVQTVFLFCLTKAGSSLLHCDSEEKLKEKPKLLKKQGHISKFKVFRSSIRSAETIYMFIISLISSALIGLWFGFLLDHLIFVVGFNWIALVCGILLFVSILCLLMFIYMRRIYLIYSCLDKDYGGKGKDGFNRAFKKAWTLHTYYEEKELEDIFKVEGNLNNGEEKNTEKVNTEKN